MSYLLAIDQSTSGTKALLFDGTGALVRRCDRPHRQKISENGWVAHDPLEIWENTLIVCRQAVEEEGISHSELAGIGITNQRETAMVWNRDTGEPIYDAIVWQCSRGAEICGELEGSSELIRQATGLPLSPYFSAAKIAWVLRHTGRAGEHLCAGTMDSWLTWKLTGGESFSTDYSNASRTQLFNLERLCWDSQVCQLFGISEEILPQICDSNACYGMTDLGGFLQQPIPIHSVLGDSHAALFGQGCLEPGMVKATYGTGSSVMMNAGEKPVRSGKGLVTSLAWGMDGKVSYVLEGNINYSGAVIQWAAGLGLIDSPKDAGRVAASANPEDSTYLVPAFTGLGAPYWDSQARAVICGMTRSTGRAELIKAAEECIAYQITDLVRLMTEESGMKLTELRVDGGPTRDSYLMQFQSDLLAMPVAVPPWEELSGTGAAYAAGISLGLYTRAVLSGERTRFVPKMSGETRTRRYKGWQEAVNLVLSGKSS